MKIWAAIALSAIALTSASMFTVRDAVLGMAPNREGAQASYQMLNIVDKVYKHCQSSKQTQDCVRSIAESFENFHFQDLYDSDHLVRGDKGRRGLTFTGQETFDGYALNIAPTHQSLGAVNRNGEALIDVAFKKNYRSVVGDPSFSTHLNMAVNTGKLSQDSVLALWEGLLYVMSPDNVSRLKARRCREDSSQCDQLYDVMESAAKAFPRSCDFLRKYFRLRGHVLPASHEGVKYSRVTITLNTLIDDLHRDYPWLAAHLVHLQGAFRLNGRVTNANDLTLMEIGLNAQNDFLTLNFCTRDGKIVPYDGFRKPIFAEEYYLTELEAFPFDINVDLFTKANGLTFVTKGIRILADYERLQNGMLLNLRSDNLVETKVSGRALHVFPTWSLDWLLPVSMEEIIYDFSTVIIQANGGEGSLLKIVCDTRDPDGAITHVYASTEILDNFFVQFGAKMATDYFSMGRITQKEARGFFSQCLDVMMADLKNMAAPS